MPFQMSRIHGNSVMAERTVGILRQVEGIAYTDVVGFPRGWGKTFRLGTGTDNWFHVAIPTVSQIEGSPMFLDQFFVFWHSDDGDAWTGQLGVDQVHIYDGSARLWEWYSPGLLLAGDWSNPRTLEGPAGSVISNTWVPRSERNERFHFYTAFGISLHVGSNFEGNITFHSAGCNWVDSVS